MLLGQLFHLYGIDNVILERQTPDYVLGRIRAGLLEEGTVALLDEVGAGARAHREGLVHHGVELAFGGARHRIDMHAATGKTVMIYGQTEVTLDLMNARKAAGLTTVYQAADVKPHDFDSDRPRVTYVKDGVGHEIECDFIAGCDGFHGVSRASVKPSAIQTFERIYPFGWLGILSETPPVSHELIYSNHARGFCAVHHALDAAQPLLRAMPARRPYRPVAGRAILGRTEAPARPEGGRRTRHRSLDRKEHRALAQLRRRADAVRPDVSGRRCRPYRAADRRQGTEPRRQRRALSLAARSANITTRNLPPGSTAIRRRALARVWKAVRFSWWMTSMLHKFPDQGEFGARIQLAELDYLVSSKAASTSLSENYVGLPF